MKDSHIAPTVRAFMDATIQNDIAYNTELCLAFRKEAIKCRNEARKTGKPVEWFRRVNGYNYTLDYNGWASMVRGAIKWLDELGDDQW